MNRRESSRPRFLYPFIYTCLYAGIASLAVTVSATIALADAPKITEVSELGIKITAPAGWSTQLNTGGFSLVMEEPVVEKTDSAKTPAKTKFVRNITLAAIHRPSPIDEMRAKELSSELMTKFGKDSLVSNYKVLEYKFFNYRAINDGLIVYSSLRLGEHDMTQMHVLVSGQERQFLMTYTDFAEEFKKQGSGFTAAWNSMISIEVSGSAPQRYRDLVRNASLAGGAFLCLSVLGLLRTKRAKVDYDREADSVYQDESNWSESDKTFQVTQTGIWKLSELAEDGSAQAAGAAGSGESEGEDSDLAFSTVV